MTNTPNVHLMHVILELKKQASLEKAGIWKRVAQDLSKSSRLRRSVNVARLSRVTAAGEVVVVPGKVLGSGSINHSLTVAAWDFSQSAKKSITEAKGSCISILELMKKEPKGKTVRIIG